MNSKIERFFRLMVTSDFLINYCTYNNTGQQGLFIRAQTM